MRKSIALLVAGATVLGVSSAAYAAPGGGSQTGQGTDAKCADGSSCPTPADPTAGYANLAAGTPLFVGAAGDPTSQSGGVALAIGSEGQSGSVGRLSISGNASTGTLQIYAEDYTDGNQVAGVVSQANTATGCALLAPEPGTTCGQQTGSDAVLITISGQ